MKRLKQSKETYISLLFILGIIVLVNFFSYQLFLRLDLTQNKEFSVSEVTKNTMQDLDDLVNIKVYFSDKLPSQFISLRENIGDILDGYEAYSSGNVRVEFIDPTGDDDLIRRLQMKGIPELQLDVYEKDKLQVMRAFMGISIEYGDDYEVIPVVQDTKSLEYKITLAIKKLSSGQSARIGLLSGYGATGRNELQAAVEKLEELYELADIDLANEEEIDPGLESLLIVSPEEEIPEEDLKKIDSYVLSGGNLLVLDEGVSIGDNLQATDKENGLSGLLEQYGIKISNNLVLESRENSGVASFNQGFFTFSQTYPYWPKVDKERFDSDNTAVTGLQAVVFPWASGIEIDENKLGEDYGVSYLAKSSDDSWRQSGEYNLNPQQDFTANKRQQSNLAVDVSAKFRSPYGATGDSFSRILVVGDSDFISGSLASMADNMVFFQNITDSLSLDTDLVEVRSKGITSRPIKSGLSDGQKAAIRYLNVFGVTALVLIFGLTRYYFRKKSRFVDEL